MPETKPARHTVTVRPWDYKPTEEELNEEFERIRAAPDQVVQMLSGVRVIEDPDA